MNGTTRYALTALLAASLAAGCSKSDKATGDKTAIKNPPPATEPGASRVDPANANAPAKADAPKGPTVTLLNPGSEPRTVLRFAVTKGEKQKVEMTMGMSMDIDMPGMEMPDTKLPATKMVMGVEVTEVAPSGDMRWEMSVLSADVVDDPSVMPAVASAARGALKGIESFKGWALITNRGFVKEADISIPEGVDAQMKQMMESTRQSLDQLTAPLPEEAVGAGAQWKVEQTITNQGMSIQQTATYTLTKVDGSMVYADVTLAQHGQPQKIETPGMPPGMTAELVKLETTGEGKTEINLARVVPPKGDVRANMQMETKINAQGQTQTMSMKMGMTIAIQEVE